MSKNKNESETAMIDETDLDEMMKNLGSPGLTTEAVPQWDLSLPDQDDAGTGTDATIEEDHENDPDASTEHRKGPDTDALLDAYDLWLDRATQIADDATNLKRVLQSLRSDFETRFAEHETRARQWDETETEMRAETARLQDENGTLKKRLEKAKKSILDLGTALDS